MVSQESHKVTQSPPLGSGCKACHCFLWTWPCQPLSLPAYRGHSLPSLIGQPFYRSQELSLSFHIYSNASKRIQEAQLIHALATFNELTETPAFGRVGFFASLIGAVDKASAQTKQTVNPATSKHPLFCLAQSSQYLSPQQSGHGCHQHLASLSTLGSKAELATVPTTVSLTEDDR